MNDRVKAVNIQQEKATINENYEDSHWSKKYGVSSDELKHIGNNLGIKDKIIKATFDDKAFA